MTECGCKEKLSRSKKKSRFLAFSVKVYWPKRYKMKYFNNAFSFTEKKLQVTMGKKVNKFGSILHVILFIFQSNKNLISE